MMTLEKINKLLNDKLRKNFLDNLKKIQMIKMILTN